MTPLQLIRQFLVLGLCVSFYTHCSARSVAFARDGELLLFDGQSSRVINIAGRNPRMASASPQISSYWGTLPDDRLLVTLKSDVIHPSEEELDPTCSTHSHGEVAWLIRPDGTPEVEVGSDVLRAYPSPAKSQIAVISPERELIIWSEDKQSTITAPGKISNLGWSPDGKYLVASIYPPDWSEGAVSTASTTADFLRLQNADLYLFDVQEMKFVRQLTNDPGTEYGAFFSPEGDKVYYIWLHLTEDIGGLMELELDLDNHTSASMPARQLTNAGNDPGEVPLGRVTTYHWMKNANQLVFEAGRPDGSGEIWTMTSSGQKASFLAPGRKPQSLNDSEIIFMNAQGLPQALKPEVKQ